ncbi:motile sperm domain-containing protein 2-like [Panonychus citri]|uniref:motile sperm domain-containing protein 2-like n=1 Tax=Panonychus citri TaxID=50023 RepID=UPI0023082FBD|nr:motile sperm domain-containing protein 2-like [Panonychus citri]
MSPSIEKNNNNNSSIARESITEQVTINEKLNLCFPLESLTQVRSDLINYSKINDKKLDQGLLSQLMIDDNLLCRYMKRRRGHIEPSVQFIIGALEWRHSLGLDKCSEETFPVELFSSGGLFILGHDNTGNTVLHIRVSHFYKIPELIGLVKQFVMFHMYKADEMGSRSFPLTGGWVLVFDCSNASLAQGDPEMLAFINSSLKNYFPAGQKYILIINLNWVLRAIKTLAFTWYPSAVKNRIKFISIKQVTDYIPLNELPDYLGGSVNCYRSIPKNCTTLETLRSNGSITLAQSAYDKIIKILTLVN